MGPRKIEDFIVGDIVEVLYNRGEVLTVEPDIYGPGDARIVVLVADGSKFTTPARIVSLLFHPTADDIVERNAAASGVWYEPAEDCIVEEVGPRNIWPS